jgi:outer membrane lipoprotein LolB
MNSVSVTFLRASILLLVLFVSACSNLKQPPSAIKKLPTDITKLDSWTVRGKVLIKTDTQNLSGYFYWQKQQNTTSFSLNTFIGINILTLTTENNLSTLEFDGNVYQDTNPSRLILRTTGIQLPLENLEMWIKGRLIGNEIKIVKTGKQVKQFNYLTNQNDWQVKYSKYKAQNIYTLPMTVNLTSKQTKLKLAVSGWEF